MKQTKKHIEIYSGGWPPEGGEGEEAVRADTTQHTRPSTLTEVKYRIRKLRKDGGVLQLVKPDGKRKVIIFKKETSVSSRAKNP